MMGDGMMNWGMGFGGLWMLLLLIGLIILTVWIVRQMFPQENQSSAKSVERESAIEVAERRYARGEIDKEQFESLKRDLQ